MPPSSSRTTKLEVLSTNINPKPCKDLLQVNVQIGGALWFSSLKGVLYLFLFLVDLLQVNLQIGGALCFFSLKGVLYLFLILVDLLQVNEQSVLGFLVFSIESFLFSLNPLGSVVVQSKSTGEYCSSVSILWVNYSTVLIH